MKEGQPTNIQRNEYTVPSHLIETTDLSVDINEDVTQVKSVLKMIKNPAADASDGSRDLILDGGKDLETLSIRVDGRELSSNEYTITDEKLSLFDLPESFELETQVAIKPQDNTALEGCTNLAVCFGPSVKPGAFDILPGISTVPTCSQNFVRRLKRTRRTILFCSLMVTTLSVAKRVRSTG